MAKVITFSQVYPSYHPRKGEPTNFVEKFWESLIQTEQISLSRCCELSRETGIGGYNMNNIRHIKFDPKGHTVRAGHRFKAGDWFSPRVWSGKPYRSPQIIFCHDIQVLKTWDFECHTEADDRESDWSFIKFLDNQFTCYSNEYLHDIIKKLALNDGFSDPQDFLNWVQPSNRKSKPFIGQVICWSNKIEYP